MTVSSALAELSIRKPAPPHAHDELHDHAAHQCKPPANLQSSHNIAGSARQTTVQIGFEDTGIEGSKQVLQHRWRRADADKGPDKHRKEADQSNQRDGAAQFKSKPEQHQRCNRHLWHRLHQHNDRIDAELQRSTDSQRAADQHSQQRADCKPGERGLQRQPEVRPEIGADKQPSIDSLTNVKWTGHQPGRQCEKTDHRSPDHHQQDQRREPQRKAIQETKQDLHTDYLSWLNIARR